MKLQGLKHIVTALTISCLTATAQASEWKLDTANSKVGFLLQGLLPINAVFEKFEGKASYDPKNLKDIKISFVAQADSLNAGLATYRLKDPDNFSVEKFSTVEFSSTTATADNATQGKISGNLTMRNVSKPVSVNISVDPAQSTDKLVVFKGTASVKRSDWGMTSNPDLAADDVQLMIEGKLIPAP